MFTFSSQKKFARCHNETIKFRIFSLTEKRFRDLNFMIYFRYLLKRENQILPKHLHVNYHTYKVCVAECFCSLTSDQKTYSTHVRMCVQATKIQQIKVSRHDHYLSMHRTSSCIICHKTCHLLRFSLVALLSFSIHVFAKLARFRTSNFHH